MREFDQAFTVFGGAFVPESHYRAPQRKPAGPMTAIIVALLLGSVTAAGAITGLKSVNNSGYAFSYSKASGVMGIEVALY